MISIGQQASGWKSIEIGRPRQGDRSRISGKSKDFINCNGRGRGFEDGEDLAGVSWDKGLMLGSKLSSCNQEVCTWYYISKYQIVFNFFQNHMLFVRLWMFWVWTKIKMSFSRQPDAPLVSDLHRLQFHENSSIRILVQICCQKSKLVKTSQNSLPLNSHR